MLNLENHSYTSENYTLIYYQTLEEVSWFLRLEKPKNDKNFQENMKKSCMIYQKIAQNL